MSKVLLNNISKMKNDIGLTKNLASNLMENSFESNEIKKLPKHSIKLLTANYSLLPSHKTANLDGKMESEYLLSPNNDIKRRNKLIANEIVQMRNKWKSKRIPSLIQTTNTASGIIKENLTTMMSSGRISKRAYTQEFI